MNTKYSPHAYRRSEVNFWIGLPALILIIAFIVMACSCSPKYGCPSHSGKRHMSGYGYGWIKCKETGKVCILAPDGSIVISYYEPSI